MESYNNNNNNNSNNNDNNNNNSECSKKIFYYQGHKIAFPCCKDLKDQFIGMNIKQKVRIKIRQTNINIFCSQILLE